MRRALPAWASGLLLGACDGPQSTLDPAGRDAEQIADLWWWMFGGAAVVWLLVMGLAVYAVLYKGRHPRRETALFIIGGGVVFPVVVLTGLLVGGLRMMPALLNTEPSHADTPRVHVSGEQWWWRMTYEAPGRESVEAANELHLPVGHRVPLALTSPDVVHALWVPALGGKMDMLPGRVNRMALEPTRTGRFNGVCAEYCGDSHSRMVFDVVVHEPEAFDAWLTAQAAPARPPEGPEAQRGARLFLTLGCGACHTIRGTAADGPVGPDLTHVGSRRRIAGVLPNTVDDFDAWIRRPQDAKPGAPMPAYDMIAAEDLRALAVYLKGLQ